MIQSIDINRLRNSEYIQFINQFLHIVSTHNATTLQVKEANDELANQITSIESSFKNKLGSDKTDLLKNADIKRDECITGIYYYLLGLSSHFDQTKKNAANALLNVLKVYGSGIAAQNYNAETATLNSLVNDLKQANNLANTNTLGITDWVLEMEAQNANFDAIFLDRNKEAGENQKLSIDAMRLTCNKLYLELKDLINAYYNITKKATIYVNCINELNALVTYYSSLLQNRTSIEEPKEVEVKPV